jgi:hypothetical protein
MNRLTRHLPQQVKVALAQIKSVPAIFDSRKNNQSSYNPSQAIARRSLDCLAHGFLA